MRGSLVSMFMAMRATNRPVGNSCEQKMSIRVRYQIVAVFTAILMLVGSASAHEFCPQRNISDSAYTVVSQTERGQIAKRVLIAPKFRSDSRFRAR